MKFITALAVLVSCVLIDAASIATLQSGECISASRGLANERPFVAPLAKACDSALNASANKTDPWAQRVCVAAAVAATPETLRNMLSCTITDIVPEAQFPNLDYNVYASIVGDCAWQKNGCPITKQNFVDLIYSSIETESSPVWPTNVDDVKRYYVGNLLEWANTGNSTPYTNFNDYLHFGGFQPGHCVSPFPAGC
ncbi:hypothetical protein C8Q79DRAFT_1015191 [Trametes meyenii]|nr:hypothetical protein C8Q79DRAFT_1015191 [Trametes meyenii]